MRDVVVLCYHALSPDWAADLSITPDSFARQIEYLAGHGYVSVTFSEAASAPPARRTVAITFDDAFRSVLETARPILDRHGMKATVFVPTAFPGRPGPMAWAGTDQWVGGPHERELSCMSWDELRELAADGWEIGSHTVSHPRLTQLDDAALDDELRASRAACEAQVERTCDTLAYPYGDADDRVAAAAGRAGYRFAATLPASLEPRGALLWPRVGIYHADAGWRWRLKLSPGVRRARASAAWRLVERARGQ
jgi:peptidoglycan/xylan/chitin deacetylase (PgdA/CDA1 family)